MSKRVVLTLAGLAFFAVGVWQMGSGAYIEAKAHLGQYLIRSSWVDTLVGGGPQRPWSWADTWPVARLEVPRLDEDLIVLAGATGQSLAWGPGHQDGSALPGAPGASVIAGHRDTHMAFLEHVVAGDALTLTDAQGAVHRYSVVGAQVVHKDKAHIENQPGEDRLVLVTCWPFDSVVTGGPLRYVVEAAPVAEDAQTLPAAASISSSRRSTSRDG